MHRSLSTYQTDSKLLQKIKQSLKHRQSPEEIFEQRISYVFGMMKPDSGVTKERIREVLSEHYGY